MEKFYDSRFNYTEIELPHECVEDCSASGSVDSAVAFWQKQLQLNLDRKNMILELREYGAWEDSELEALEDSELEEKIIWLGACDISESDDFMESDD